MRNGECFDEMKLARRNFRNALNYCKKNELEIKKKNVLKSYSSKNEFWKQIRSIKKRNQSNLPCIDGENNSQDIIRIFENKYKAVLDCRDHKGILPDHIILVLLYILALGNFDILDRCCIHYLKQTFVIP